MSNIPRKAVLGAAAAISVVSAAFMTTGSAHASTAAQAAPASYAVQAAPASYAVQAAAAVPQLQAAVWPIVRQGAVGERVFAIQYLLNARIGAGLATDGVFGPLTAAAVRKFQSRFGLQVDGVVGPQTWTHLIVQVQQGSRGSAVAAVQHNLRFGYGFTNVAVDGIFGPITAGAVRSFQARFKIGVDGIVGPVTWNTLVLHEG
jgi:peptidoglycan hydrolase-like protein with peptidoglycan-binding domain